MHLERYEPQKELHFQVFRSLSLAFLFYFQMQKVADESKVEKIFALLGKIDDDKDGQLKVDDVLKVFKVMAIA